jgi:PAS domain S-box-containing protein
MSVPKRKIWTKSKAWKDLAIIFVVAAVVFIVAARFDSFEKFAAWSAPYNSWQVNEIAAVLVFLAFAFAVFSWRRWKELKAEIHRRREYRDLFQLANDPILIFDAADATVLDVNDKACEVYGIAREEFICRKLEEIANDPGDARRRLEQVRTEGRLQNFETTHIRGDGSPVHLLINRSLIRYLGREAILSIDRDVTQGKRAEEALLHAERKYREIFENAGEGIFQSTPDGKFITANPALARMLGFDSPEELIAARKDIAREHYVDPQRREEFKARLYAHGFVKDFELEAYRKDGTRIWTTDNVRAVRDDSGSVVYYEGTSQDITDRKRAEARSAAFATLARKLSGARTQLDAGLIIAVTAKELFGWDACTIGLYDADRDLISSMLNVDTIGGEKVELTPALPTMKPTARCRRVLDRGPELQLRPEPIQFDPDSVPFGDTIRPSASLMTVPVRHATKIVGLLSIQSYTSHAYDGRALKDLEALADHCGEALNRIRAEESLYESEERFRQLAENIDDVIWIADRSITKLLYINSAYEKVFGLSRERVYERLNSFLDAVHPDDRESVERMMARQIEGDYEPFEYRIVRSDGTVRWILRRTFPILNDSGEVYRVAGIGQDITERKRAEESLSSLRRELEMTMESMEEGVHRVDLQGKIVFVNQAAARMLGCEVADLMGRPAHLTKHHTRADGTFYPEEECPIYATLRDGISLYVTNEVFWRQDGTSFPVEYTTAPMRNDRDEMVAAVVTFRDITESKRAEEALRESEERYRDLVENSHELICTHDLNGLILSANRAACVNLGYDVDSFVGKRNIRDILAPEVRDQFDEYLTRLRQNEATSGLMLVQTKSGERRVWEYYNSLRSEGLGTPIVRGMARDITDQRVAETALRESEERYRELFENAKDAIYVHDLKGRYISVNRAAEKLSGYAREEIIGKHFSNFIAPSHLKYARENLCRKLDEQPETTYEAEIVSKTGRRTPVEVSSRLVYENGQPVGVQGTARDISERKQTQEALRLYSRALIEAQETERQRIARELHDEIGQVLTAVRINLQTAKTSRNAAEADNHIEDSIRVTDEALRQVRDLSLDLRPPHLDDFGLTTALRWLIDRFSQRMGIVTEFEANDGEQRLATETETACFRIAQEALTNVARHAKAKRVSVSLNRNRDQLFLIVKDDGVGFDVNALKDSKPVALGLRGMKERAKAVGGLIDIDSADGKGTQVRARFPIV